MALHSWVGSHARHDLCCLSAYVLLSFLLLRPIARRLQNQGALAGSVKQQRISFLAILSVLSSSAGFLMPFVGSILGVAFGHFARRRCRAQLAVYGSGIALAGLILGYIGLAYSIYVIGMVSWVTSTNVS